MNNYNQLHNLDNEDNELIISVHNPKEDKPQIQEKKPTLHTILLSSLKAENFKPVHRFVKREFTTPVPKYTLICFLFNFFIFLTLLVMQTFTDLLIMIPLTLLFSVLCMPTIILTFFIELNTRRNVRVLSIIFIFLIGLFSYTLITSFCDNFLVKFIYREYLDLFVRPVAWTIVIYLMVFICTNVLKVQKIPECLIISISFALGYAVAQAFFNGFSSLFVQTKIQVDNSYKTILTIINEPNDLKESIAQMGAKWFETFIYMPVMLSSLAVIVGTVVSQKEQSKINQKPMIKSLYLLILLNVMLYITAVIDTTFDFFNLILKAVSFIVAVGLSIRMIDYCLEKECK